MRLKTLVPVIMMALSASGCAVESKSYPVSGQTMMGAEGRMRIVPAVMAVHSGQFQYDNAIRVQQDGAFVGICMSYVYRGPETLWETARAEYARSLALVVSPPSSEQGKDIALLLDAVPGYRLIPGVRMGVEELKKMPMTCFTTDLPWGPAYAEKGPGLRMVSRR